MKGWDGARKGPCTLGEAKTMTAIICGAEPDEIEAFMVLATIKCEECGEPHQMVTNLNVAPVEAVQILTIVMAKMIKEIRDDA